MTRAHIPLPSPRHHLLSAHRESSFEAEFLNRTNCEIWAYDASVDEMGDQVITPHPRVHFNKVYIGPRGSATLGSLMKQNGHHWIDFLKMDIESAEFDVMEQIVNEFEVLPWTQLQIEIHVDNAGQMFPKVYKMWERFEDKGLRAFKSETNHAICVWGGKTQHVPSTHSLILRVQADYCPIHYLCNSYLVAKNYANILFYILLFEIGTDLEHVEVLRRKFDEFQVDHL